MNTEHRNLSFSLRPVQPDDEAFLYALYGSTRAEEMAAWNWSEAQQEAFLRLQFSAWQQQFRQQSALSDDRIILIGEQPGGRIMSSGLNWKFAWLRLRCCLSIVVAASAAR